MIFCVHASTTNISIKDSGTSDFVQNKVKSAANKGGGKRLSELLVDCHSRDGSLRCCFGANNIGKGESNQVNKLLVDDKAGTLGRCDFGVLGGGGDCSHLAEATNSTVLEISRPRGPGIARCYRLTNDDIRDWVVQLCTVPGVSQANSGERNTAWLAP